LLNESTNKKTKRILTSRQWSANNLQYAGATYDLTPDTTTILGYTCKKALISLNNGRQIIAWYTPAIKKPVLALEPAFSGVPGLVLRYEYTCRKKTLRYTATSVSSQPIDPAVFAMTSAP
jgi:GLPGLI family protein